MQEIAYDFLRGSAAAVAAVALDPGDDGVRLRAAALRARAQDVLHRLPDRRIGFDSIRFEWTQQRVRHVRTGLRKKKRVGYVPRGT